MLKSICKTILHRWLGWRIEVTEQTPDKCIICVAPHTSNWDFIIGELYYTSIGLTSNFLMKKEWFFWPFGRLLKRIGGIPVERSKHTSMTDQLAQKAKESSRFSLAITPEGTRSLAKQWKRGFYFIALKAQLPILLYAIDYPNKRIVCTKTLHPSGNVDADMRIIMEYYRQFEGKHPEKFVVEEIAQ
ncbi:1-acyl-sn-glycerol-3-phosphate acyltransferase [Prevotellamassilia timonensis]|uniref:1-acyl-sn-glycerol-3-phosphate acyltransferase n=1 Tax=Prevotellamassilia timonensis TaxID=1852370 RepID=UPI00307A0B72